MRLSRPGATLLLLAALAGQAFAQAPAVIGPEAVRRAKAATVYIRVTTPEGEIAEGSGFLAVERGIVITNAHVVGMLHASSKPPSRVEVVVASGQPEETALAGKLLGIDRVHDLAVLKVEGKLPPPLPLVAKEDLYETQKVYIFGFPFGAKLGRDITVSESSISSLRKDAGGALERIQVNGGMHPGNSGGPVVDSLGQVVGVSVAAIRATSINFAIPAKAVRAILDGGFQETTLGETFRAGNRLQVPVRCRTLDPFGRIREVRIETWTGAPSAKRPYAADKASPQPGDGPRKTQVLPSKEALAAGEVVLPAAVPGQVVWVQPVLVRAGGDSVWGRPVAVDPALALERLPADLIGKLAAQKERTVRLKTSQTVELSQGTKFRVVLADSAELDILETFVPDPKGALIRTAFGRPKLTFDDNGRKGEALPEVGALLQRIPPVFIIDETNKLRSRTDTSLNPRLNPLVREQVEDFRTQICNGYEAATLILPHRKVMPGEAWQVKLPMLAKIGPRMRVFDLALDCIYEGTRTGRGEAVVTCTGKVQGREDLQDKTSGDVEGKFTFNLARGFISSVTMKIASESSSRTSELHAALAFRIDLTRVEGNPLRLEPPKFAAAPTPPRGVVIFSRNGILSPRDPLDPKLGVRGARVQVFPLELERGKKVSILLDSAAFDCFLRLVDPDGRLVAEDDDGGGGLNSRIDFTAPRAGPYRIMATSFDGKLGAFRLQVIGERAPLAKADDPPKALPDAGKGFDKPARSAAPTSYLKVVSTPGDYIGRGKSYEVPGDQLKVVAGPRGITVRGGGWNLDLGAPLGQVLQPGEYRNAERFPFNRTAPGLAFYGMGRGSNRLSGEFMIWELEMIDGQVVRLAADFVQRSEVKGPPLHGKLRYNSNFE